MGAMAGTAQYVDGYWWSKDGLRLHYRDYPGRADRPPILCIPGLTRNARDFAHVAERLAGDWRLICVDMRGRGESGYSKLPMSYGPLTYLQDLEDLLDTLGIEHFVSFGTSLGGLMTMMLAAHRTGRIAGALLNDIGPVIEDGFYYDFWVEKPFTPEDLPGIDAAAPERTETSSGSAASAAAAQAGQPSRWASASRQPGGSASGSRSRSAVSRCQSGQLIAPPPGAPAARRRTPDSGARAPGGAPCGR